MKVSEITYGDVANYLRLGEVEHEEVVLLNTIIEIAKSYISSYTGIPTVSTNGVECLDDYPELVIVVYILCQDMYDNRTLYVDKSNLNNTVKTILDMHTRCNIG